MITISSLVLLLSLFLAYRMSAKDFLGKASKALMAMTFFASALLLCSNLGYVVVDLAVQDGIRWFSAVSLIGVGMMLNTHGRLFLMTIKASCFTFAALHVLNSLISNGYVMIP